MKRVGLWGAYNCGLLSDDILYQALSDEFKRHGVETVPYPSLESQSVDFTIVGGGTMLGTPLDRLRTDSPFGVLGAAYRDGGNLDRLKTAKFIYVRGEYSKSELAKHNIISEVSGDPICLFNGTAAEKRLHNLCLIRRKMIVENLAVRQWLATYDFDMAVSMAKEDIGQSGLYAKASFSARNHLEALEKIAASSLVLSCRCHPYFAAIIMGIPAMVTQFEFNKVWDVMSGFKIAEVLKDSVIDLEHFKPYRFPFQIEVEEAQKRIATARCKMQKLVEGICREYLS